MYDKEKIFKNVILGTAIVMAIVLLVTQSILLHLYVSIASEMTKQGGMLSATDIPGGNTSIASLSFVLISIIGIIIAVAISLKEREINSLSLFILGVSIILLIISFSLTAMFQGNSYKEYINRKPTNGSNQNSNLWTARINAARIYPANMTFVIGGSIIAIGSGIGLYKVTH